MYVHLNNVLIVIFVLDQVFSELQEIGKDIKEEVQDIGVHAHGDMGGDISKCPYYAAKMGELLATLHFLKYIVIYYVNVLQYLLNCFPHFLSSGEWKHDICM